uniref:capsular polysaccharide export protein, LipB/KpsS family n=1 Tax=Sphingomonas bacterium TaxID=1895847 RepID=UPI00157689CA
LALVAVATLAGAEVRLLSPGRFALPSDDLAARRERVARHVLGWRYRDPFADAPCSPERTIALLALWRATIDANRPIRAASGMAWWKRAEMRRFLWVPGRAPLAFRRPMAAVRRARAGESVALWPSRFPPRAVDEAARRGVVLVRVEDGFVRSAGLGANLVPPLSVTVDRLGIHYDPAGPSELEAMLAGAAFPPALLERARALRTGIVAAGLGKYGAADPARPPVALPPHSPGRKLVLVPGQVEDDRSVLLGGAAVGGNLGLLARVRADEPDAEIWYRPHPDVDAGHRRGGPGDAAALAHVDAVVRAGSMADLLGSVDAVHVNTSLSGFEALLRGLPVTCHGTPFYAGWGLTRDLGPVPPRRGRALALDELVAATLILYPRYLDPVTMLPCSTEVLVGRLSSASRMRVTWVTRLRMIQGRLARAQGGQTRPVG